MATTPDTVRDHFDSRSQLFDANVLKCMPFYSDMIDALADNIPFDSMADIRVLDLGSGTGNVSLAVRARFPNARITCLDFAPHMLDEARKKLGDDIEYVEAGIEDLKFDQCFDVVVSSLAIHHVRGDGKGRVFEKIWGGLEKGGIFINADIVLSSNEAFQKIAMQGWIYSMMGCSTDSEIEENLKNYDDQDDPSTLNDQLRWMSDAGFLDVEVLWRRLNFAVFGGQKV